MTTEIETLAALVDAQKKSGHLETTLALLDAYRALPVEHVKALVKKGFWYVQSATQGHITEKGVEALKAG